MSAAPRTRTRLFSAAKFTLGLALLILLVRWLAPDLSAVLRDIHLDLAALALAVLTHAVATAAVSLRWKLMVEAMGGTPLPYIIYFRAFALTKLVGNVTSSLAMDLIGRGVALRSAGSEQGLGLAMTQAVLERIFDVVLPLAMVAWALAVHHLQPSDAAAAASFLLIGLAIGGLSALVLWPLTRVALRLYFWARAWRRPGALAAPAPATPPISRGLAAQVGMLGVLRYVAVLACYITIAWALGAALAPTPIAAAMPIGQLAALIGVTPGALGIQEAGWAGALRFLGVTDAAAIALFVVGVRLLSALFFLFHYLVTWPLERARAARGDPPADRR